MAGNNREISEKEKILREKAKQALKKNITPPYSPDDEGGVSAGPLSKDKMKQQAEDDDE